METYSSLFFFFISTEEHNVMRGDVCMSKEDVMDSKVKAVIQEKIDNYSNAVKELRLKASNYERHVKCLNMCHDAAPYLQMADIYARYYVENIVGDSAFSILITNRLLEHWKVSEEQLKADTLVSMEKYSPATVRKWTSPDVNDELFLYILSNEELFNGASVIFLPNTLHNAADQLGAKKLLLLPSSIHEFIICDSDQWNGHVDGLKNIVVSANSNPKLINSDDVLTNSIYEYDSLTDSLKIIR